MGIFDAQTINWISIRGLGRINPSKHNQRMAHCRQCGAALEVGNGFNFRADRMGRLQSGFLCQVCIGEILRGVSDWFFNRPFEILQPVILDMGRAIKGDALAKAWIDGGLPLLFEETLEGTL